jgi:hypothetical protein
MERESRPEPLPGSGPRATDAERDWFAGLLQRHFADGSLTGEELSERLDKALGAKTLGELYALVSDLPHISIVEMPARRTRRKVGQKSSGWRWWRAN